MQSYRETRQGRDRLFNARPIDMLPRKEDPRHRNGHSRHAEMTNANWAYPKIGAQLPVMTHTKWLWTEPRSLVPGTSTHVLYVPCTLQHAQRPAMCGCDFRLYARFPRRPHVQDAEKGTQCKLIERAPRSTRAHASVLRTTWRTASKKLTLQGPYAISASMLDMCTWHLQTCSLPQITGGSLKFPAPADPTAARPTPSELLRRTH